MIGAELNRIQSFFTTFQTVRPGIAGGGFAPVARRKGYTLIEVMIAVTLTLILMYALAAIFGRVTSIMTQTQDILSMTNNLRAAKDRLREDLENLTVPRLKAPTSRYGFFSYSEGMGNAFAYLDFDEFSRPRNSYSWFKYVSQDYFDEQLRPNNFRGFAPCGNFDRRTATLDTTVGDTDDILSFTVRAPAGKWFRGRCFKELSEDTSSSDYAAEIDDNIETIESEYAEIIWFLRGTTLYRRVLLIVPDELLEKRLQSLNRYVQVNYPGLAVGMDLMPSFGYGFYRFFDISVHYDSDKTLSWNVVDLSSGQKITYPEDGPLSGRVVANTVSDLANRENRFGYWNSPVIGWNDVSLGNVVFDLGLHGKYGSWYWMRMPTLQESALWTGVPTSPNAPLLQYFEAGMPLGVGSFLRPDEEPQTVDKLEYWTGPYLQLTLGHQGPNPLETRNYTPGVLPDGYFIDQWQYPNPWSQQQAFSGQLDLTGIVDPTQFKTLNNDVLLTNVLSFDVKVWNDKTFSFVDLGESLFDDGGEEEPDPTDFRSAGNYGPRAVLTELRLRDPVTHLPDGNDLHYRPVMPAVFDTWTEDYEKEFLTQTWPLTINGTTTNVFGASSRPGFTIGDIPLDGNVTASDLPDYPPPYEAEIKVIQVELRAFDPVSRTIKNATVEIKIP